MIFAVFTPWPFSSCKNSFTWSPDNSKTPNLSGGWIAVSVANVLFFLWKDPIISWALPYASAESKVLIPLSKAYSKISWLSSNEILPIVLLRGCFKD